MISAHTQTPHLTYTYGKWGHTGTEWAIDERGLLRQYLRMICTGRAES